MCGISFCASSKPINKKLFQEINKSIEHRGPDSGAIEYFQHSDTYLAIGHRRLSIIDLSNQANQPMKVAGYTIVFNGEIYNYIEIRNYLKTKGYKFNTESDTEVLIQAYRYWGPKCLDKFNGMFSFLIYNENSDSIFIARDRFGIKPLYYYQRGELIYVCSEIKQILADPSVKKIGNIHAIGNFLENRYMDYSNRTFFQNIYQLQGGHYAKICLKTFGIVITKWYDISKSTKKDENLKQFYNHFKESIKLRLRSDVSVGSCLSGGVDSNGIVCTILKDNEIKNDIIEFNTITSSFEDKNFDEMDMVEYTLKSSKNIHPISVYPSEDDFFKIIEKLIFIQDEPFWSSSIFAQFKVFQSAKNNNIKVMLDGQGADEIFCGYSKFFYPTYFKSLNLLKKLKEFKRSDSKIRFFKFLLSFYFRRKQTPHVGIIKTHFDNFYRNDFKSLKEQTLHYIQFHLPALLHYEDRNSMYNSIESRLPYLDFNLVEYGFNEEDEKKININFSKVLLRESFKGIVPDEILWNKKKKGFLTPQNHWMLNRADLIASTVLKTLNHQVFDIQKIEKLLQNFGKNNNSTEFGIIMRLYTLSIWIKVFGITRIE